MSVHYSLVPRLSLLRRESLGTRLCTLLDIDCFNLLLLLPFLVHILYMYIFVCIELMSATKKTFAPEPALIEFKEMFNVKEWMTNVTPSIHDHLKAHQFKFVQIEDGGTRMFLQRMEY